MKRHWNNRSVKFVRLCFVIHLAIYASLLWRPAKTRNLWGIGEGGRYPWTHKQTKKQQWKKKNTTHWIIFSPNPIEHKATFSLRHVKCTEIVIILKQKWEPVIAMKKKTTTQSIYFYGSGERSMLHCSREKRVYIEKGGDGASIWCSWEKRGRP